MLHAPFMLRTWYIQGFMWPPSLSFQSWYLLVYSQECLDPGPQTDLIQLTPMSHLQERILQG